VLLWGFVIAAIVAVRHDVFSERVPRRRKAAVTPAVAPSAPTPPVVSAPSAPSAPAAGKPSRADRRAAKRQSTTGASRVVVVDGPLAGTSIALSSLPISIGRAADSTIILADDDYVSNHHARLVPQGETWLVEDTGSTNGTFLGEAKVTAPVVIPIGGRIRVGRTVLELQK
jgi:hypothetical protein